MNRPFTKEDLTDALSVLIDIQQGGDTPDWGICDTLTLSGCRATVVKHYAPLWEEFSGDTGYPVPSDDPMYSSDDKFSTADDLWDKDTEYGQARYRLVDHLIKCIENELNAKE